VFFRKIFLCVIEGEKVLFFSYICVREGLGFERSIIRKSPPVVSIGDPKPGSYCSLRRLVWC